MKIVVLDNCGDDAEVGVGGTIAKLVKAGHKVIFGRFNPLTKETNKGAAILKAKEEWLGFPIYNPNTRVDNPENAEKVNNLLLKYKPDMIFTYWPVDEHSGHRAVSTMTIRCVNNFYQKVIDSKGIIHSEEYCPKLYFYESLTGKQTKCFHPDTYVDVTEVIEIKKKAMKVFRSNADPTYFNQWYPHMMQMLEFRGKESGAIRHSQIDKGLFAEAFIRFPMPFDKTKETKII